MSDNEYGKKLIEQYELDYFLDAYEHLTGDCLSIFECTESPDFICERSNGNKVGIELTKVMREPKTRFWDRVLLRKDYMNPYSKILTWTEAGSG